MLTIRRACIAALLLCACATGTTWADTHDENYYYNRYQWYSSTINMPQAWAISTGSPSVVMAVLDTGVISSTPDLAGRVLPALSVVPGQDPLSDTWMFNNSNELARHGTWVASAAAMGIHNGIGGAGIGNFSILPICITDMNLDTSDEWIADGIYKAADNANNGVKVINISYYATDYKLLDTAAAYARSKGILTFIGAGNTDGPRNIADFSNLIFVAGTDINDQRWSQVTTDINGVVTRVGSSYGPFVDICAPAGGIDDTGNHRILLADPALPPNGYGLNSGTSFATPMAAGAAALAWSINPNLTCDQVENMLYSTAVDLGAPGRDQYFGWGRINVGAMAQAALASIPEPATWVTLVTAAAMLLCLRKRGSRL